jgi:hypothetical protein
MAIDPYSGRFDLMTTVQQFAPLVMAYMLMQQMGGDKNADMAGARAQGMASMMPSRGLDQAQPMIPQGMPHPSMGGIQERAPQQMQVSPYAGPGGMNQQGMQAVQQLRQRGQQPATVLPPPQQGGNALMQLLPMIAGFIIGGPAGAATGASIGQALGG